MEVLNFFYSEGMNHLVTKLVATKLSPRSIARLATTSRTGRNVTSLERKRIAALKRAVRRRKIRRNPPNVQGYRAQWRFEAYERPRNALISWLVGNASWGNFVRMHTKWGGDPAITHTQAVQRYHPENLMRTYNYN